MTASLSRREARETASALSEGAAAAQRKPSRRYQVTVWSNSKALAALKGRGRVKRFPGWRSARG